MARACGVLVHNGKILLQRKRSESIWAVPGGKIEGSETAEEALAREWMEELGQRPIIGPLLWVVENQFTHNGAEITQTEHYLEVLEAAGLADPRPVDNTLDFGWFSPAQLALLDIRPAKLRGMLLEATSAAMSR